LPTLKVIGFELVFRMMNRADAPRGAVFGDTTTFESVSVTWMTTYTLGVVVCDSD
jgi:hypothetical protein